MKTAAVAELKTHLSRYLSRVKAGEEVLVTKRGVPVARLVPIDDRGAEIGHLRDLERRGLIRLGTGKLPKDFWKLPRPRDPKGLVLRALLGERRGPDEQIVRRMKPLAGILRDDALPWPYR